MYSGFFGQVLMDILQKQLLTLVVLLQIQVWVICAKSNLKMFLFFFCTFSVLSLTGSVMASLATSLYFGGTRFDMVHVQNSTLAGGVAVGATADLSIKPASALSVGIIAGILSVWGYARSVLFFFEVQKHFSPLVDYHHI